MTGGPALRFCFAFLQATARAWMPKSHYLSTHTHTSPSLGYTRPDAPKSARTQHGRTQTSRPRAGWSHTQHWATHDRPRQRLLRRSTAACRDRVTHMHTHIPTSYIRPRTAQATHGPSHARPKPRTARHARDSPDAAWPHADTPATLASSHTQHWARRATQSARTQHGRTQTSRPRAGWSHTQHWATHDRPRQRLLRRSTAACRDRRVTHTHTHPHMITM